jgi:hypothetical protein
MSFSLQKSVGFLALPGSAPAYRECALVPSFNGRATNIPLDFRGFCVRRQPPQRKRRNQQGE